MKKFWNFTQADDGDSILRLDGYIAQDSWFGDEVTPKAFMSELSQYSGNNITVWINSAGGDVFAGSQIYTALKEHSGTVTVKIDGIAASAASVIAMAGDIIMMSPTSLMMIHNPLMMVMGEAKHLEHSIYILNEVKESIINAYEFKTGISRTKLSHLMDDESWFNAKKAVELGFADKIMYNSQEPEGVMPTDSFLFGRRTVFNSLIAKLPKTAQSDEEQNVNELSQEEILPEETSQETTPTQDLQEEPPPEQTDETSPVEEPNTTGHRAVLDRLEQELELI